MEGEGGPAALTADGELQELMVAQLLLSSVVSMTSERPGPEFGLSWCSLLLLESYRTEA